jgi:hypothetical protein
MKNILLTLTAVASLTMAAGSAFADLHDTYAQSCAKYGGKGTIDKKSNSIVWHVSQHLVAESFYHNECVRMTLISDSAPYEIADVERIMPFECGNGQSWFQFDGGRSQYIASWSTTDGLLVATLYSNGSVQFAYTQWLKAKDLLSPAVDYGTAPIEDTPARLEQKTQL